MVYSGGFKNNGYSINSILEISIERSIDGDKERAWQWYINYIKKLQTKPNGM